MAPYDSLCFRQSDVWTLLAAAVKQSPAGKEAQLEQAVRLDLRESDKIIKVSYLIDKTSKAIG